MSAPRSSEGPQTVACVGLGIIGCNWAAAFLAAGLQVRAYDSVVGARRLARSRIGEALGLIAEAGRIASAEEALSRLSVVDELGDALRGSVYVQESVLETVEAKRACFADMSELAGPGTLFGSSTSSIAGSTFLTGHVISSCCIVAHPVNPPYAVPLVELSCTPETSDETYQSVRTFLAQIGQRPVLIRREILGYVLNRLQSAVVGEALHLVTTGVIDPIDLDTVMSVGLAPRWSLGGPFLTGHLNAPGGYLEYMTKYGHIYRDVIADLRPLHPWTLQDIEAVDAAVRREQGGAPQDRVARQRNVALLRLGSFLDTLEDEQRSETL